MPAFFGYEKANTRIYFTGLAVITPGQHRVIFGYDNQWWDFYFIQNIQARAVLVLVIGIRKTVQWGGTRIIKFRNAAAVPDAFQGIVTGKLLLLGIDFILQIL